MVDLHTHSTASDGTFFPAELVKKAKEIGLSVLDLTDHDTLDGIAEAEAEAVQQGITFITGVEISVEWKPGECHMLGLGVDRNNVRMQQFLKALQADREERNLQITEKLKKEGFDINYKDIQAYADGKVVGRPHFAAYMAEHKMVKNIQTAFDKYLAKGRSCFVERKGADFESAVTAIKNAGGVPVLAHPLSLYLSWGKLPDAVKNFKNMGLMGLEAWHPGARYAECRRLEALAESLSLIVTAGSDFHGTIKQERKLGLTAGGIKIEDRFYENFLKAKKM